MSDALRGNPIALRSCILYDFLLKKTANESYENLCSVFGTDVLPREEFDFWVNRFENGIFELDLDTGNVAKVALEAALKKLEIRSKSTPVEFSDLTTDVLKVVIEKSQLEEQFIIRKVSHGLRSLVDQVRPNFENLRIFSDLDCISLRFDNTEITYAGPDFKKRPANNWGPRRYYVIDEDYRKMCLEDLNISLKNRKLKLESLEISPLLDSPEQIENSSKLYDDVLRLLKSIDSRRHVKELALFITNQDDVLSILQRLKPGVLNDIRLWRYLRYNAPFPLLQIDKLTETEQWKRAGFVDIECFKIQEPIESFYHLCQFAVRYERVTPEMLKGLRDALSKSTNFKHCEISTVDEIKDVERIMGPEKISINTLIYSIPNSSNYLETFHHKKFIVIKKKSKD